MCFWKKALGKLKVSGSWDSVPCDTIRICKWQNNVGSAAANDLPPGHRRADSLLQPCLHGWACTAMISRCWNKSETWCEHVMVRKDAHLRKGNVRCKSRKRQNISRHTITSFETGVHTSGRNHSTRPSVPGSRGLVIKTISPLISAFLPFQKTDIEDVILGWGGSKGN